MNVFEIVMAEIGDTTLTAEQINSRIGEVGQAIKTYCNRNDIPQELNFVQATMVLDLINIKERSKSDTALITKSITEGDVQVQMEAQRDTASESATQSILFNYTSQLNKYRKLRW